MTQRPEVRKCGWKGGAGGLAGLRVAPNLQLVGNEAEQCAVKPGAAAAAAAKSLLLCPTLYDPIDDSPPGSSVHGIFQARVLEWGAIAFSETRCTCILLWSKRAVGSRELWSFFFF